MTNLGEIDLTCLAFRCNLGDHLRLGFEGNLLRENLVFEENTCVRNVILCCVKNENEKSSLPFLVVFLVQIIFHAFFTRFSRVFHAFLTRFSRVFHDAFHDNFHDVFRDNFHDVFHDAFFTISR